MQVVVKPDFLRGELEGQPAHAYNESAFRYFLSIERKRSERSGRPFALLLVARKAAEGPPAFIDPGVATKLFSGLSLCLRETDFAGWYQQGAVAGAVLTHLGDTSGVDVTHHVRRRISHVGFAGLLPDFAERFVLSIYQLPAQEHELGENRS